MTIAEVSRKYNMTPDTLRYYERVGLLPSVCRTSGGRRDYTDDDCSWVEFIKCMRGAGLPVDVLIEYVELFGQGESTQSARKELLVEQRRQLLIRMEDMKKNARALKQKNRPVR